MSNSTATTTPTNLRAVDEYAVAEALGLSVSWVRKDRRGARLLPFSRLGGNIRYNLEKVRQAFDAVEQGGPASRAA